MSEPTAAWRGGARISDDGFYRYRLWRQRCIGGEWLTWVMCNPSTADADTDDPTIRKCIGFAQRWGYDAINVVNLCALRARDPRHLLLVSDPVGPYNADELDRSCQIFRSIVVAWGNALPRKLRHLGSRFSNRADCLGVTSDGQPRHPLMLPYSTQLETWNG